jgi:hypothetical protein
MQKYSSEQNERLARVEELLGHILTTLQTIQLLLAPAPPVKPEPEKPFETKTLGNNRKGKRA